MPKSPEGDWPDSSHLTTLLGFEPTAPAPEPLVPLFDPERQFDVCHVGLVLRAVLGVQIMLGLGMALAARNLTQWGELLAAGTVVTLTGVLLWLLVVCAAKRLLARWREPWQWTALALLGAVSASLGWALLSPVLEDSGGLFRDVAVAIAGAATALLMLAWLKLRERSQRPAAALARLVELQSRIRPHFLFNTLNSAIALVRVAPDQAESMLEDLSELFRVALADADAAVQLSEEIELARRYLAIEQLRFGERLRITWELDARADGARVPPLLLQPLVENAVRYGVEPNEGGGDVLVRTALRGGEVEVLIVNSIAAPAAGAGHGLALRNVRQRLRLMHDVAARFEVDPQPSRFTVRIVLPR
ncbi:MAG TPA: histidine kinase [Burkholderiaceae bacterium]